jgi:hypothetical protein
MGARQQRAVHQRDQRIDRVARDNRQRIAREGPGEIRPARLQRQRRISQPAPDGHQRHGRADQSAQQNHGRVPGQPGAAHHQDEGEQVLDDHQPGIGRIEEPRPGDGAMIVEEAGPDAGEHGGREHHRRQAQVEPGHHGDDEQRAECDADAGDEQVQRRADLRLGLAAAQRIEAHGREPDPVHHRGVDQDDDGGADRIAAEFRRPEEKGDQQPENEVQRGVDDERQKDRHRVSIMRPEAPVSSSRVGGADSGLPRRRGAALA